MGRGHAVSVWIELTWLSIVFTGGPERTWERIVMFRKRGGGIY